jgi:DNA-binding HxlR family transcriptional regulator
MRPEWILTPAGERLAPACGLLLRRLRGARLGGAARRKWAFPVLLALLEGRDRFSALGAALPGVTARALAQTLRDLEAAGAVTRRVVDARPPRVVYRAAGPARPLGPALLTLAAAAAP